MVNILMLWRQLWACCVNIQKNVIQVFFFHLQDLCWYTMTLLLHINTHVNTLKHIETSCWPPFQCLIIYRSSVLHSSQLSSANCNDNGIITIYFLQNILLKDVPCDIVNLSTICGSVYHKLKIMRKKLITERFTS